MSTDWPTIRLQYEVLHEEIETLAVENGTSVTAIKYAIKKEGWERKKIATAIENWENLDPTNLEDGVIEQVENRFRILSLLKQSSLNPHYIALESAILQKATAIAKNLPESAVTAAGQLKAIVEALTALKEQQPIQTQKVASGGGSEGLRVFINNRIEGPGGSEQKAKVIEISQPKLPE